MSTRRLRRLELEDEYLRRIGPNILMQMGVPVEHLKIGECIFTRRNILVSTVLGSCVSLTFYHEESGAAGMFHSMLPASSMAKQIRHECNYVDLAVEKLLNRFQRIGVKPWDLKVKLFGGGNTLRVEERRRIDAGLDIGKKNVDAAREAMDLNSMRIVSEDVLGDRGRKVLFYTGTGQVWVRDVSTSWF